MSRCYKFKYNSVKVLLLTLASELANLFKKFQSVLKIWTKCRLNFHEVECTTPLQNISQKMLPELFHYKIIWEAPVPISRLPSLTLMLSNKIGLHLSPFLLKVPFGFLLK